MIALQVENIRDFMNKLLLKPVFDEFRVSEAAITTFTTFSIDGQYRPEFYDPETIAPVSETQVSWQSIRPFCLSVFKGKRLPLAFHIVLQLPQEQIPVFLAENNLSADPADVFGLFLNIQYRGDVLTVTTGSSLRVFSQGHELDHAWDRYVRGFLAREDLN